MAPALHALWPSRRPPLTLTLPLALLAVALPIAWLNWTGSWAAVSTAATTAASSAAAAAATAAASSGATTAGTAAAAAAAEAGPSRPSPFVGGSSVAVGGGDGDGDGGGGGGDGDGGDGGSGGRDGGGGGGGRDGGGDGDGDGDWHWPSAAQLGALWMSADEASRMLWAMHPGMTYLEYGSGGSTLAFAPMARRAYSVEHSADWCGRMRAQLAAANLTARVTYVCEPVARGTGGWGLNDPFEEGDYKVFKTYVDTVTRLNETTFDVVLIDGRARVACALRVLPYLSPTSTVILHDARRAAYAPLAGWYDQVGRVVGARGARLLRRKPSVVPRLPLSDDAIHAARAEEAVARVP
ncbi:hypothetical protein I4F81_001815 [Pyropia yezoensis]|uniref:Uncharacterized protein n=1 Tax=Pyropia yezoensis TaxID=2788 RepID=A0ACC3BNQ0_PYRYE|nr:hypothetical protein I4F81_001815 [Neopyropia yezoensis]